MDVVLVIAPRIIDDFGYTPAGAALLKGSLSKAGFSSKILDLNADLEYQFSNDPDQLLAISNFFMNYNLYNSRVFEKVDELITNWTNRIVNENPKWVGLSVFSYNSQRAVRLLAIKIKMMNPDIKIVIGGAGITTDFVFSETLYKDKIIDAYIRGEGELSIIELLQGNTTYPGINGIPFKQIDNINSIPFPEYDDYKLDTYTNKKGLVALPITGSRGCVRSCTFCDIASQWPKYKFREGKNIAEEIKYQIRKHNAKAFRFTDSLINGSLKAFKEMIYELAEYNNKLPVDQKFSWDSHFIIRSSKQMPPKLFDVMKQSGAGVMLIGVESGSQSVRDHMKKGFTQSDLDYCMEQFDRVGIKTRFLMIVGYPTETETDFQQTLDMFTKYQKYQQSGTIEEVNLGLTLNLLHNTPLSDNADFYGISRLSDHQNEWICKSNPKLDYKERLRRRIYLQQHIEHLGYKVFESKNYTKQLFIAWSEVSQKRPNPKIIEDFQFDRERGGLIEKEFNKNEFKTIQIKSYANKDYLEVS